jgi:glycosyltransferase involved in cell wall biosynthesis
MKERLRSIAGATPRRQRLIGSIRRVAGPLRATIRGHHIRAVVKQVRPDVVHGMRIPHEAMSALAACPPGVPLVVSIWGIDFSSDSSRSRLAGWATRRILARTDLLFADCQRDIDHAAAWGLRPGTVTATLPGGGGIDLGRIAGHRQVLPASLNALIHPDHRLVVNARGRRPYVRNEVLLDALSLLADELDPRVRILFVDSVHDEALQRSVQRHRLADRIVITGKHAPGEVLSLFGRAEVSVSITDQDGTPNSLLEAMAGGAIPVCGDLPSIREWIEHGKNGYLAAFDDPCAVAGALRAALALSDEERMMVRKENARIVAARAERGWTGRYASEKYRSVIQDGPRPG